MSRVGKHPVKIASGVTINLDASSIRIEGKFGKTQFDIPSDVIVKRTENESIVVTPANDTTKARALWGTIQRQIALAIKGVSEGITQNLELSGVGYRASVQGDMLVLQLGFSHDIRYPIPSGVIVKCEKPTSISITSHSKQQVGQMAAEIRKYRKPEPYKGKGVIRAGEFVLRKEGKKK